MAIIVRYLSFVWLLFDFFSPNPKWCFFDNRCQMMDAYQVITESDLDHYRRRANGCIAVYSAPFLTPSYHIRFIFPLVAFVVVISLVVIVLTIGRANFFRFRLLFLFGCWEGIPIRLSLHRKT
jgi:hypothetical protein